MKRFFLPVLTLALIIVFVLAGGFVKKIMTPSVLTESVMVDIPEGASVQDIGELLQAEDVIGSAWAFRWYALLSGAYQHLPSGKFQLDPGLNTRQVVQALASVTSQQEISVTLLEGWNIQQMDTYLSDEVGVFAPGEFTQAVRDYGVEHDFLTSVPKQSSLEGFLFPDTYRIFVDSSPQDLINKMLDNFGQKVTVDMRQAIQGRGLTVYEGVILASLLEREVQTLEDKQLVAGIILQRLQLGMHLQLDSSVLFALGRTKGHPSPKELLITSPYNTYVNAGLPPGPISNPGLDSLRAVAQPILSDYVYFVTDTEGKVYYSTTYEQHQITIQRLYP